MCKTGFSIRDDGMRCEVCGADSAVTPLVERSGENFDFACVICQVCVETGMEETIGVPRLDIDVGSSQDMAEHLNRAINVAVEQISARMLEYLDSMEGPRG